jgi:hypothetical protein
LHIEILFLLLFLVLLLGLLIINVFIVFVTLIILIVRPSWEFHTEFKWCGRIWDIFFYLIGS